VGVADRFILKFENDAVDANNFQEYGIETVFDPGVVDLVDATAQIIAYASCCAKNASAEGTRLTGIMYVANGTNMSVPLSYPATEVQAIVTANSSLFDFPAVNNAYGLDIGDAGNTLAPLGTSIVMSEYTDVGGPGGRGRHFLPFIGQDAVDGAGFARSILRTALQDAYNAFIRATDTLATGVVNLQPVVENAAKTTVTPITNIRSQPVFSNLSSRRR